MVDLLGMQLEAVRTVLQNDVNEISVCTDLKRRTGVFYTMVSIIEPGVRLRVAALLADGLFSRNSDFLGSFSQGDRLNLVFLYRDENPLERQEAFYATNFARRKKIAENLVVALAETQVAGSVGELFLSPRNLNISPDLSVALNYFLDFQAWQPEGDDSLFYRRVAQAVFQILSREFHLRFAGQLDSYPSELQAFYKKAETNGFYSHSAILTALKLLPDEPEPPRAGLRKLAGDVGGFWGWVKAHGMAIFIIALVAATAMYAGWQIAIRLSYRSAAEKNTAYAGLESIGDVNLGDDTI